MFRQGKKAVINPTHVGTREFFNFYADTYFREYVNNNKNGRILKTSPYYMDLKNYTSLLDKINSALIYHLVFKNLEFKIPYSLGVLKIVKSYPETYIKKDRVVILKPVNWDATLKLWGEDPEALKKKKLIRFTNEMTKGYVARFLYLKDNAKYINKSAYRFKPCRTAKLMLKEAINTNELDFYLK